MNRFKGWAFIIVGGFLFLNPLHAWAMAKRPPADSFSRSEVAPKKVLTLEECYALALRRSETIAIRREEISKTRANWLKATGDFIGSGDFVITDSIQDKAGGGGTGDNSSVGSTLSKTERRERKFVFSQPLFQGFRTMGALNGAGSLTKQRKKELERSKELLFVEVVEVFYRLMRQRKDVETIEGVHQLFEERTTELNEREKIGRSRPSEVSTAKAKMKILEAQLAQARGALAIAESLMEFYTGIPSEEAVYQEKKLPAAEIVKPVDYSVLVKERPDVEALRQAAKIARQSVVVAQSELWPEISLDGNRYEMREGFQSDIAWDVLFTIKVPLYKGGETLGELKESYSEWKQAKLNYSLGKRQAELEIKESYQNWVASLEQNKAFKQAVKAAQENYRLQREEYTNSLVNNLDVLAALEELFNTSKDANLVYYQMKENYWRFQTAVGKCCETSTPAVMPPASMGEKVS